MAWIEQDENGYWVKKWKDENGVIHVEDVPREPYQFLGTATYPVMGTATFLTQELYKPLSNRTLTTRIAPCEYCGRHIQTNWDYCHSCGAPVKE